MDKFLNVVAVLFGVAVWAVAFYYFWQILVPVFLVIISVTSGLIFYKLYAYEKAYEKAYERKNKV